MRGVLSGVAGRSPAAASSSSSSSTPGTIGPGVAQQLVHRAGLHRGVGAPLLDGGADDDRAVAARHQVDRAPVHQAAHRAGQQRDGAGPPASRRPEAQDVALDRAERGSPAPASPSMAGRPVPAARTTWSGREAAAVRQDELGPGLERGHGALDERHAAAPAGLDQRAEQGAVVDLVVARDLDAAAERRAERGHEAGGTRWRCGGAASRPSECW